MGRNRPPELTGDQIQAINRFPDQNPNPVLRVTASGELLYANPAAAPILAALGAEVGHAVPEPWLGAIREAASSGEPIEVTSGPLTFELVAVDVVDLGFVNVYGTDVTARKAVARFPDANPHPVFRIRWDGTLVYANPASTALIAGLGCSVGRTLGSGLLGQLLARTADESAPEVEIESAGRTWTLKPVDVPEFRFINVYGTDVTAVRQLETLHRENERLLLNILPEPIADRLRRGEQLIADRFEDVTLLFADIVEFTRMSSGMSPDELVGVLNGVFTVFDGLVDRYGLEKVKTIGDAYMVVGGMPERSTDHTERVAEMALDLAEEIGRVGFAAGRDVRFRIGIHCGPVIAGVIGTKKFIYDVWGDTVNVASRMESLGVPGRVQISGAVEERLRGRYVLEPRGLIDVKGKGLLPTWFLESRSAQPKRRAAVAQSARAR
jgi:class 3 adenylate cyclase